MLFTLPNIKGGKCLRSDFHDVGSWQKKTANKTYSQEILFVAKTMEAFNVTNSVQVGQADYHDKAVFSPNSRDL